MRPAYSNTLILCYIAPVKRFAYHRHILNMEASSEDRIHQAYAMMLVTICNDYRKEYLSTTCSINCYRNKVKACSNHGKDL